MLSFSSLNRDRMLQDVTGFSKRNARYSARMGVGAITKSLLWMIEGLLDLIKRFCKATCI